MKKLPTRVTVTRMGMISTGLVLGDLHFMVEECRHLGLPFDTPIRAITTHGGESIKIAGLIIRHLIDVQPPNVSPNP